jgi:hypothetical protein
MVQRIDADARPHRKGSHPSEPRLIRGSSFPEPATPAVPKRSGKRGTARNGTAGSATQPARVKRVWADDEDRYLRKHYPRGGTSACAKHLGRTEEAVKKRVHLLGIRSKRGRLWTAKEDLILRRQYPKVPAARLATMLKRSYMSIRMRLLTLGLTSEGSESWTNDELAYLRAHAGTASHAVLAAEMGRTKNAVQLMISRMGLRSAPPPLDARTTRAIVRSLGKKSQPDIARELGVSVHQVYGLARKQGYIERPTSRPWTADDEAELRRLFPTMTNAELARELDRTLESIMVRSRSLGLYRKGPARFPRKRWTREEERLLIRLWKKYPRGEIARRLGRTPDAVGLRAKSLGCLNQS